MSIFTNYFEYADDIIKQLERDYTYNDINSMLKYNQEETRKEIIEKDKQLIDILLRLHDMGISDEMSANILNIATQLPNVWNSSQFKEYVEKLEKLFKKEEESINKYVKDLQKYVLDLINTGHIQIYGHGTNVESAEKILKEGLKIYGATEEGNFSLPLAKNMCDLLKQLYEWNHRQSNAIIFYGFDVNTFKTHSPLRFNCLKLIEYKDKGEEKIKRKIHHVFIIGYLDCSKKIFHVNKTFNLKDQKFFYQEPSNTHFK
jgi:hypothetical protein